MKIDEVVQLDEELNVRKLLVNLAASAVFMGVGAGIVGMGKLAQNSERKYNQKLAAQHYKADPELTRIGRDVLKTLPEPIQKKLGNIDTIDFVKGIPENGDPNAVCQTDKIDRVIFVNPKYVERFENGAEDQLSAHEATHIVQNKLNKNEQDKFPPTNEKNKYGQMTSPDAWKILANLRKNGDRMWNHSREEQAMIVQQRQAQYDSLNNLLKYPKSKSRDAEISLVKNKIAVYDQYINDYNNL